jgi:hypothetical protein
MVSGVVWWAGISSSRVVRTFALTSLVGIGLAVLFVRQSVTTKFDTFVLAQHCDEFVAGVARYYAANGSWARLTSEALYDRSGRREWNESDDGSRMMFTLANQQRTLVLSTDSHNIYQPASAQELGDGVLVVVSGVTAGTVFVTGTGPALNSSEQHY